MSSDCAVACANLEAAAEQGTADRIDGSARICVQASDGSELGVCAESRVESGFGAGVSCLSSAVCCLSDDSLASLVRSEVDSTCHHSPAAAAARSRGASSQRRGRASARVSRREGRDGGSSLTT